MPRTNYSGTITTLLLAILSFMPVKAQEPPFTRYINHPWVDSVISSLSVRDMVAQSIWMAAWSNREPSHTWEISKLIEEHKIGGLIFFQGDAAGEAALINHYQSISRVPLMIAMDAEWGPGMRLDNLADFPYQMTLGAIRDDSLLYSMGIEVARQLRRLGIRQNLAPVADINNNPSNPVINFRSFGEDRDNVISKSIMYSKGLQDGGVSATAKHFPGHGDTDTDSHLDLPVIRHSRERFDTVELVPFRRLAESGINSIMSAHLNIPAYYDNPTLPSTLSPEVIQELLIGEIGFSGLVITDAMNMKGLTRYYQPGEADAMAYAAGNDILEYVNDAGVAIDAIMGLLKDGKITTRQIEERCRKILAVKYWAGLAEPGVVELKGIEEETTTPGTEALIHELYSAAITLLVNSNNIVPVRNLESTSIATLTINGTSDSEFARMASNYTRTRNFSWSEGSPVQPLLDSLSNYDLVLALIAGTDQRPYRDFGITAPLESFLAKLVAGNRVIAVYQGNPYGAGRLKSIHNAEALLLTYQENDITASLSAQLIFGGIGAHGRLPVTIDPKFPAGSGILSPGGVRLRYGNPELAGISSAHLIPAVDSIVRMGLEAGAFPGCEVIAARRGTVFLHKTYGFHTYEKRVTVKPGDMYDLASVTKVSAPTTALMMLDDMGLFDPAQDLSYYFPSFKGSDKASLSMREILAHQSGMIAWIPYWQNTVREDGSFRWNTFKPFPKKHYSVEVTEKLWLKDNYRKKIYSAIEKSPLGEKRYLYSGLTFYIFPEIISKLSGSSYEDFLYTKIYRRLGAYDITFNPRGRYSLSSIVPTEDDTFFRKELIHGYVHDEGAAMMGGVSGNAGLFATGNDLLKLFEMLRRYGSYGGEQVLSSATVKEYTSVQYPENGNRRGLGFDKPLLPGEAASPADAYPCPSASESSFGHSGFTGTFAWADPESEITYVFLSNRVLPTRDNNLISSMNIRTSILQAIYDSITD